jgi:hypothetical protein
VKAVFAILFCLLLLVAQTIPPEAAAASPQCPRCDCGMKKCCLNPSLPRPAPASAAPALNFSPKQLRLAVAFTAPVMVPPVSTAPQIFSSSTSPSCSAAVPLYEWNCAWLI